MSATLYLLRQQPDRISRSLFRANDADIDIILLEQAASSAPAFIAGAVVVDDSRRTLTYVDLVERVFSSERVVVL
jgi:hypothetical protein